jgi:hypothetical protein
MPIPYKTTRYGCQHRCGTRRRNTVQKAEMHEAICWKNPALKTCRTCKNEIYDCHIEDLGDTFSSLMVRSCKDEAASIMIQQEYANLLDEKTGNVKPVVNCPFWESKNEE